MTTSPSSQVWELFQGIRVTGVALARHTQVRGEERDLTLGKQSDPPASQETVFQAPLTSQDRVLSSSENKF